MLTEKDAVVEEQTAYVDPVEGNQKASAKHASTEGSSRKHQIADDTATSHINKKVGRIRERLGLRSTFADHGKEKAKAARQLSFVEKEIYQGNGLLESGSC